MVEWSMFMQGRVSGQGSLLKLCKKRSQLQARAVSWRGQTIL
jgi:hypothetical protein